MVRWREIQTVMRGAGVVSIVAAGAFVSLLASFGGDDAGHTADAARRVRR